MLAVDYRNLKNGSPNQKSNTPNRSISKKKKKKLDCNTKQQSFEEMVRYYTETSMIKLQIDLITKRELCSYYVQYLDEQLVNESFLEYHLRMIRNNQCIITHFEKQSHEKSINGACKEFHIL